MHPACSAVGPKLIQEVNGVVSLVRGLSEGVGPSAQEVARFSLFYKQAVKQLYSLEAEAAPKKCGTLQFGSSETVYGKTALLKTWDKITNPKSGHDAPGLADLQAFRTYSWLLTEAQRDEAGWLIHAALKQQQQTQTLKQIADGKTALGGAAASTSSSKGGRANKVLSKQGATLQAMCNNGEAGESGRGAASSSQSSGPDTTVADIYRFFVGPRSNDTSS